MKNEYYLFINLPLPYAYDALEPFIDEKTMHLHHDRHLQTYINNLNKIMTENPSLQKISLNDLLINANELPKNLRTEIINNAGGIYNHRFFFDGMSPHPSSPTGALAECINEQFSSFENFKNEFKQAALSVFGSGYAWLVVNNGKPCIVTFPNQDCPLSYGMTPIIALDVWEHAYYLKYYNMRADYIDAWFNICNWHRASQIFAKYCEK